MKGRKHSVEQIISKLREAEVALATGQPVAKVVRQLGITEQTYYRWRKEYGGLRTVQARRLKELKSDDLQAAQELLPLVYAGLSEAAP